MKCPGDQMSKGQAVEMARHDWWWSNTSYQQQVNREQGKVKL